MFDGAGSRSLGNDFARNVLIFGVDNISSSHTNNWTNNVIVLDEQPTDDINYSIATTEQKNSTSFTKANNFFHYNCD